MLPTTLLDPPNALNLKQHERWIAAALAAADALHAHDAALCPLPEKGEAAAQRFEQIRAAWAAWDAEVRPTYERLKASKLYLRGLFDLGMELSEAKMNVEVTLEYFREAVREAREPNNKRLTHEENRRELGLPPQRARPTDVPIHVPVPAGNAA